jgi:hypothetical protein
MLAQGMFGHMAAWRHDGPTHVRLDEATVPHLVVPNDDALVAVAREIGITLGDDADLEVN